jgi:hypothetical protein
MPLIAALVLGLSLSPVAAASDEEPPGYVPGGRRDPFVPPGAQEPSSGSCPGTSGLSGFRIRELALRGLVHTPSGDVAMLLAPDQRSYFAAPGQRFCDGGLLEVRKGAVVFDERVEQRLAPAYNRTVVRPLHP